MSLLSTLGGLLAGLVGREAWEWLPTVTRAVIWVATLPLSAERREIRRSEWTAELKDFEQRRLSGLVWALCLLPVCLWEAAGEPGVVRRLGRLVEVYFYLYMATGVVFIPTAFDLVSRWHLSTPMTVVFMAIAPPVIGTGLVLGAIIGVPLLLASPLLLLQLWLEARSRRKARRATEG